MSTSLTSPDARWHPDDRSATLLAEDGSIAGTLEIVPWHSPGERQAALAWAVSWLDPSAARPTLRRSALEVPTLTAVDAESACCSFLSMRLARIDDTLVLDVTGPHQAQPIIAELFA